MASVISIMSLFLNIKGLHINKVEKSEESVRRFGEIQKRSRINLHVRPYKRLQRRCPICGKVCSCYDHGASHEVSWRANSYSGVPVYLFYNPSRIICPEHGVLNEQLPWADGTSRFTADFNNETAFLAMNAPKTVVAQYLDINWRTVRSNLKQRMIALRQHGLKN